LVRRERHGLVVPIWWHDGCFLMVVTGSNSLPEESQGGRMQARNSESGRIGYLVLYLLGAPLGVLILLWVLLGDNVLTAG
jgi:hypothetical protein